MACSKEILAESVDSRLNFGSFTNGTVLVKRHRAEPSTCRENAVFMGRARRIEEKP